MKRVFAALLAAVVVLSASRPSTNAQGIDYEENDDFGGGGDIVATLCGIKTQGNGGADGDAGLKLREKAPET